MILQIPRETDVKAAWSSASLGELSFASAKADLVVSRFHGRPWPAECIVDLAALYQRYSISVRVADFPFPRKTPKSAQREYQRFFFGFEDINSASLKPAHYPGEEWRAGAGNAQRSVTFRFEYVGTLSHSSN